MFNLINSRYRMSYKNYYADVYFSSVVGIDKLIFDKVEIFKSPKDHTLTAKNDSTVIISNRETMESMMELLGMVSNFVNKILRGEER